MIIPLPLIFPLKDRPGLWEEEKISGEQLPFNWLPCEAWSFPLAAQQLSTPKLLGLHARIRETSRKQPDSTFLSVTCGSLYLQPRTCYSTSGVLVLQDWKLSAWKAPHSVHTQTRKSMRQHTKCSCSLYVRSWVQSWVAGGGGRWNLCL